jgi:hypothetical protein
MSKHKPKGAAAKRAARKAEARRHSGAKKSKGAPIPCRAGQRSAARVR